MLSPRMLIVQPWFSAIGHPAQSVLNTARALEGHQDVRYLISLPRGAVLESLSRELEGFGPVSRFWVPNDSLRVGTLLGVMAAARLLRRNARIEQVLFLDAHLVLLATCWPLLSRS